MGSGFLGWVTASSFYQGTVTQPFFLSPVPSAADSGQFKPILEGIQGLHASCLGMELALGSEPGTGIPGEAFASLACLST